MKKKWYFLCAFCLIILLLGCRGTTEAIPTQNSGSMLTSYDPVAVPPPDPIDAFLEGDLSVVEEDYRSMMYYVSSISGWEYIKMDLDGDGEDELFLRGQQGYPPYIVFHEQEGRLLYWDGDLTGRLDKFRMLLADGTMVLEDYYPWHLTEPTLYEYSLSLTFFHYESDGERIKDNALYGDPDNREGANGIPSVKDGQWNDTPLTKEEFETYYQQKILDIEAKNWTPIIFTQ